MKSQGRIEERRLSRRVISLVALIRFDERNLSSSQLVPQKYATHAASAMATANTAPAICTIILPSPRLEPQASLRLAAPFSPGPGARSVGPEMRWPGLELVPSR